MGVSVATPEAALIDLLRLSDLDDARTLAHRAAQHSGSAQLADCIAAVLSDSAGLAGARRLRALIEDLANGAHSEAEHRLVELLNSAGFTGFHLNYRVLTPRGIAKIDVAFAEERLAIEMDGRAWHSSPGRFQRDREGQNNLVASAGASSASPGGI